MGWNVFDEGKSVGARGSEDGVIRCDEEHELGARITLEAGCKNAPFAITCGIYGWMFHTRYFGSETVSHAEFEQMKLGVERVLAIIPYENESTPQKISDVCLAIETFVKKFP